MAVAVLVVNYRSYDALSRCLDSLMPQLASDDEIQVVDHDTDARRLDAIRAAHPRVGVDGRPDNPGFAAGVNRAARSTSAEHLLLLNPDTLFLQPVVRGLEAWLLEHPDVAVVGPRLLNADGSVQPSARGFPGLTTLFGGRTTWLTRRIPNNWFSRRNLIGRSATGPVEADWLSGACLMTPRQAFDDLGGLDEKFFLYWEDADYCRRVQSSGRRCMYLPHLVAVHSAGASAASNLGEAVRQFHVSAYRWYWKHAGATGRVLAPVVRAGLWLRGEVRARSADKDHPPPNQVP